MFIKVQYIHNFSLKHKTHNSIGLQLYLGLYTMYIQYIHEVDRSQTPGMRPVLTQSWSCAYILESAAFVLFHSSHTPRYSFQVMRCKALTAPHDSAMLRCSLYLLLSEKGPKGPSFPKKKKKVSIFKPRRTIPKGTVHDMTMHDPGSVWKLMSMKETKRAMHRARVCVYTIYTSNRRVKKTENWRKPYSQKKK